MQKAMLIMSVALSLTACNEAKVTPTQTSQSINESQLSQSTKSIFVSNEVELKNAIKNAQAGDNITLKNGTYTDIRIQFYGQGTKESPITLKAETPGKVFIEGESNLHLGGTYLIVDGFHFRNGYSPTRAFIRFKINDDKIAFHSKITNSVIEEFTQLERDITDHWIEFWGQHNELSNNYITGKSNFGPTIMVELKGNQHVNNYHQIINNHFGPRPRKGGPHGETIQIGNSSTSMTPSFTNIENNLFDRCNGEIEIISSKSNYNQFKNNVFFESEGSLVLRHGNYATIDGNVFIGNDTSKFFGGIRVINTGHWITNNYFYKLKGESFRAPIAVMNGIPKSPLNRYNQVTDVVVAYNSFIESPTPWYFSVGSNVEQSAVLPKSEIRSARPVRTIFANNLIYNSAKAETPIYHYDKVDGVSFYSNISNQENTTDIQSTGLVKQEITVKNHSTYFTSPTDNYDDVYNGFGFEKINVDFFGQPRTNNNTVGATITPVKNDVNLLERSNYGTNWFSTEQPVREVTSLKVATTNELINAIQQALPGDIIELTASNYAITEPLIINKNIVITSVNKKKKAILNVTAQETAFTLTPKSFLHLDSIIITGDKTQNALSTLDKNMSKAYDLSINNTEIYNFNNVLNASKGSFADTITVTNSKIKNNMNGLVLNTETDNKGDYNVEFLTIKHSIFDNISGTILDYHRGGYDESTIGGNLVFEHNTVSNSGKVQKDNILIKNRGIVNVSLKDNTFTNNSVKIIAVLWGEKGQKPVNNTINNSGNINTVKNLKLNLLY